MFESWASRKIQDSDDDQKQEHDGGASPTSKNVVENGRTERMEWTADNSSRNLEKTSWSSCGSFAERLAARANSATTDRPNTARFKCMPPSRLPISRSNCLNIPPGLSATTLLDSPILLSTSQSEPSPTTGKFPLAPFITCSASRGLLGTNTSKELNVEQGSTLDFSFKPLPKQCLWNPLSPLSSLVRKIRVIGQFDHLLSTPMVQSQSELKSTTMGISKTLSSIGSLSDQKGIAAFNSNITVLNVEPLQAKEPFPVEKPPAQGSPMDACVISEQDQKVVIICQSLLEGSGHDGYNWRKYGKKQVKGSEHPRNYYKCTQANCNAKKKVKQTEDGQMMEIVYEGDHNHHKPQLTRRMHGALWESAAAAAAVENVESGAKSQDPQAIPGVPETQSEEKGNHSDKPSQVSVSAAKDDMPASYLVNPISPRSREALNATLLTEAQNAGHLKALVIADGAIGAFLPSTRDDLREDVKDLGTSIKSSIDDCSEEEADLKRRKLDKSEKETAITPRTPRERRVVVETTSSVDFLEDGYRWRKYGQKNVKGNPNPRSYYKCANAGCPVRKQVERSSENSEAVITTYEGKHNHDIPAPRYSGQDMGVVHVVQSQNGSNALNVASAIPSVSTDQDKGSELQESLSAARSTWKNTDTTKASIADFGAELITKSEGNKVGKHGVSRDFGSQDDAFLDSNTTEHPNARFQRGILLVNVADGTESLNKQEHLKSKDERDNNQSHGSSFLLRLTSSTASVLHQSIPPTVTNGPLISS